MKVLLLFKLVKKNLLYRYKLFFIIIIFLYQGIITAEVVVVVEAEAVGTEVAATGHRPLTITRAGLGGGTIDMTDPDLAPILQVST